MPPIPRLKLGQAALLVLALLTVSGPAAAAPSSDLPFHMQDPDRMFKARIYGPYALSVRDGLNEMLIGTNLMAQGVQAAADPYASLDLILSAIPSALPAHGYISSGFGDRASPFNGRQVHHNGVDFAVPYGSAVYASADGVVIHSGWYRALGRTVMIDHGFGIMTRYGHNSGLVVNVGDHVRRGDLIARAGSTGRSTGTHVHYEVWVNDRAIDPMNFMFEVPDRPLHRVAMDPYKGQRRQASLGLAMGGDADANISVKVHGPSPKERLPFNLAIVGIFAFISLGMIATLLPLGKS